MSGAIDPRPMFQVEKQEGTYTRTVMRFEEDVRAVTNNQGIERKVVTRKIIPTKEEYRDRYMLYFPQGHSICVDSDDEEQLNRLGVFGHAPMVDMNTGEIIPDNFALTNKEIVERRTRNRPRPANQGGLSDLSTELGE